MKITAVKEQVKNPERVSLFVDGKFTFSLTISQLVEARLKSGLEISAEDISGYKKLSAMGKRRMKVLNWVTLRPRSSGELRTYLKMRIRSSARTQQEDSLTPDEEESLSAEMIDKGYVNDERFAEWWMGRRTSQAKSAFQLKGELLQKGVDAQIIAAHMSDTQNDDALIQQVLKLQSKSKYRQDPDKLIAFLMRKGFRYSDVKAALDGAAE